MHANTPIPLKKPMKLRSEVITQQYLKKKKRGKNPTSQIGICHVCIMLNITLEMEKDLFKLWDV